ncbi:MAG: amidohydrolase family protein, partial [Gemmatimonadales bacterium]
MRPGLCGLLAIAGLFGPPRLPAQQTVVVRAARMLDVVTGRLVAPAVVTLSGDRIQRVGGTPPEGAQVVDLGDATLLP